MIGGEKTGSIIVLDSNNNIVYSSVCVDGSFLLKKGDVWPLEIIYDEYISISTKDLSKIFLSANGEASANIIYRKVMNSGLLMTIAMLDIKTKSIAVSLGFMDSLLHEIRTPVNIINTAAKFMASEVEENPKTKKYLDIILRNGNTIRKITGNIMMLLKENAASIPYKPTPIDVCSYLKEFISDIDPYTKEQGFEILLDFESEDSLIFADMDLLDRIFINLTSNAYKFFVDKKQIIITVKSHNDEVIINYKDFGRGIPENEYDIIFDKYAVSKGLIQREREGCGIGLHIVKRLVNMHNGTVKVKSIVGKWTELTLTFPICKTANINTFNDSGELSSLKRKLYLEEEFSDI